MDKAELKKKLHRYCALDAECKQILRELGRVKMLMGVPKAASTNDGPRAPGIGDPVHDAVARKTELENQYYRKVAQMMDAQKEIEDLIDCLEPTERQIMRYRYLDGLTWEEICVAARYGWAQVHRVHSRALDTILEKMA